MQTVTIRCFAALRERAGRSSWEEPLRSGDTVRDLYARLFPPGDLPVAFVLNRATVAGTAAPAPGDEVAFLPPVGGG